MPIFESMSAFGAREMTRRASNLTELWRTAEKQAIIDLAVTMGIANGAVVSDFEWHRALFQMLPRMPESRVRSHCEDFLKTWFGIDVPLDEAHCEAVWRRTAEALLCDPRTPMDLARRTGGYLLTSELAVAEGLQGTARPILDANALTALDADSWETFRQGAADALDRLALIGGDRVWITVPEEYRFEEPNPFRFGEILRKKRKSDADRSYLLSQTVRLLCEECRARAWTLLVRIAGAQAGEAVSLLSYAEGRVGLPTVIWSTPYDAPRDRMLALGYQKHEMPVLPMLLTSDHPSDEALLRAVADYAARFPKQLLRIVSAADLCDVLSERARAERLFGAEL